MSNHLIRYRFIISFGYFFSAFVCVSAHLSSAAASITAKDISGHCEKEQILSWIESIYSIQCFYKYRFTTPAGAWKETEVEYRWQGDMEYYKTMVLAHDLFDQIEPIGTLMQESLVEGKGTLLGQQEGHIAGERNLTDFRFTSAIGSIRNLFRKIPLESIQDYSPNEVGIHTILSLPGKMVLSKKSGVKKLVYWSESKALLGIAANLYLDEQNRLCQIDYLIRPPCSSEEIKRWATKDVNEVAQKIKTIRLMDYTLIEGIWFPFRLEETSYESTPESLERGRSMPLLSEDDSSRRCEYFVYLMESLEYYPDSLFEEVEITNIYLNKNMHQSSFEIDIPPMTNFIDRQTNEVYTTAQETWLERHANLVIILIALGILGGITVAGWRYWLGKP